MKRFRIYADVSVYGGCFDEEFREDSLRFFDAVCRGECLLLISAVVRGELQEAPTRVREVLDRLPTSCVQEVRITTEMLDLRDAYLAAEVLTPKWIDDATHVAIASAANADAIISWNFRHLVNLQKMIAFNAVNMAQGHKPVQFISPKEYGHEATDQDI